MAGPLTGYRIVDLTRMIAGPMATMILGDQGADVIKVEGPGAGDLARAFAGPRHRMAPMFAIANRNKRSIVMDLNDARAVVLLERLVGSADVLVHNFRPGVAGKLGIGEAAMRRARPDLLYVSINGFGETGPYAHKRSYDPVIQALSGLAWIQGVTDRPKMIRLIIADKITALTASQAITAALLERARSGQGQHVRLAMLDAVISFLWAEGMAHYTFFGEQRETHPAPARLRDMVFETADGFITAGANSNVEWRALAEALEHPEWATDARFKTPAGRERNAEARLELTAAVLRTRNSSEWLARLDARGVPCAPILNRWEMLHHPQVRENGIVIESDHPHAGRIRQPRPAARFDRTATATPRPAPLLGEHTREVLGEIGVSAQEIEKLYAVGVIA
ncbi:MAG TPA: CoA transferase [Candidatus Binataceae bacterium]|nr:CoA transferase [Candidatus Binataceae bacterium]